MISYILLVALAALIALCIMRATKKGASLSQKRPQREPHFSAPQETATDDQEEVKQEIDDWEIVPIIRHQPPMNDHGSQSPHYESIPDNEATQDETFIAVEDDIEPIEQPIVAAPSSVPPAPEIVVINVLADAERPYRGYELLQVLLTAGLRYGKMGIFHRHEEISGRGAILFSLASAVEPGKFDLSAMGALSTPGLTLFMQTANTNRPAEILSLMLETAHEISHELGGALFDDKRQPLGKEKIALWQSQLRKS